MKKMAIFASGSGSNAEAIMAHFKGSETAEVALLLSNRPDAYALERAKQFGVPTATFSKEELADPEGKVAELLRLHGIDFIVLAGFLWLVPPYLIQRFADRIVNIHPALLPAHGGKGMYGDRVHRAVIEAAERESGITIHLVNEQYDRGDILFQARVEVTPDDTPEKLAQKIHALEHQYFPTIIEQTLLAL